MPKITALIERKFTSFDSMINAIGDRRNIDYMATIAGRKDTGQVTAYSATGLKYELLGKQFVEGRDTVSVWLPESGALSRAA